MSKLEIESATLHWVEKVVIGFGLCPFAGRVLVEKKLRIEVTDATSEAELLRALETEIRQLETDDSVETTLLVHPAVLQEFADYNQFLQLVDDFLHEFHLEGKFQVASFHPEYQFAGTAADDAENYTNRSPFPMLHVLREDSVTRAVSDYPDIEAVPARNIARMRETGIATLQKILLGCRHSSIS